MIRTIECNIKIPLKKLYKNKWFLFFSYIVDKLSPREISKLIGCSGRIIPDWLKKFNIPVRTLSEALKISQNKLEFKNKLIKSRKGMKFTNEHKKNLSKARKGMKFTDEHRKNISESLKGHIGWSKGLTKETDDRIRTNGKGSKGFKHSQETIKQMSESHKGENNPMYGKSSWNKGLTRETDDRVNCSAINIIKHMKNHKGPWKDTDIEIIIQNFLKELSIEFETQKLIKIKPSHPCDIFIYSLNLIIECDGDFFHKNSKYHPNVEERDKIQTEKMIKLGYNVLRLWGSDIKKMNIKDFKNIINKYNKVKL